MTQRCRVCGCSNFSACAGGCWWVEDDLCSACAAAMDLATGVSLPLEELDAWTPNDAGIFLPDDAGAR